MADQFEAAWKSGATPEIQPWVDQAPERFRRPLLVELVLVDQACSSARGRQRDWDEYVASFPLLVDDQGRLPELLASAAAEPGAARDSVAESQPNHDVRLPRVIGRLQLVRVAGQGGFATVYKAWDMGLRRWVAVKIPHANSGLETDTAQRLVREGRSAAMVRHPAIVPLHDVVQIDGATCLVSDWVEGETLAASLDAERSAAREPPDAPRRWTSHRAAQLVAELADALQAAHDQQVFHRDLKPSNILVDRSGRPHLVDFGLAKFGAADSMRTVDGQVLGTPAYMPPEQASGRSATSDARSDVYGLGAVLYELLCQRTPFSGEPHELLARVMRDDPVPPRSIQPRLPRDLETICLKCLSKAPSDRYATARELAEDLRRYLEDRAILTRPEHLLQRWVRRVRRHPVRWTLALAASAALVALLVMAWLTPAELTLRIQPIGANVSIDGGDPFTTVDEISRRTVGAGLHEVRVMAAEHDPQRHQVFLRRGLNEQLDIGLRRHAGWLEIDSDPRGSEVELDGTLYGSRVRNLLVPTGTHKVAARAEDCFDRAPHSAVVLRDQLTRLRFHLDAGVVWHYPSERRTRVQGMFLTIPDADGDGMPDLLHNEHLAAVGISGRTGRVFWEHSVRDGARIHYVSADLGGAVGPCLVGAIELAPAADSPGGWQVLALRAGPLGVSWERRGPAREWRATVAMSIAPTGDLNGDQVSELAVWGREPALLVLDGATGATLHEWPLDDRLGQHGQLSPFTLADRRCLMFARKRFAPDDAAPPTVAPYVCGALDLATGRILWKRDLEDVRSYHAIDLAGDQIPDVVVQTPGRIRIVAGDSGEDVRNIPAAGALDRAREIWNLDLDGDGVEELVCSADAASDRGVAVRLTDGRPLWTSPVGGQFCADARDRPLRTRQGALLVRSAQALYALDAPSGRELWRHDATPINAMVTDLEGDGQGDVLVTIPSVGLRCLDEQGGVRWTLRLSTDADVVLPLDDFDGDGRRELLTLTNSSLLAVVRPPVALWRSAARGPLLSTPRAVDLEGDGRLEVLQVGKWSDDGSLACLDGATGAVRWTSDALAAPNASAAVVDWDGDGTLDVVHCSRRMRHAELEMIEVRRGARGDVLRRFALAESTTSYAEPTCLDVNGDGQIDVVLPRIIPQDVVAVDGRSGRELWHAATGSENYLPLIVSDLDGDGRRELLVASQNGLIRALRCEDGSEVWKSPIGGALGGMALVDGPSLAAPRLCVATRDGRLILLDATDGSPLWTAPAVDQGAALGRPVVATDADGARLIVVAANRGGVVAAEAATGRIRWRCAALNQVAGAPVVADLDGDGRLEVVAVARNGRWIAVDLTTGTVRRRVIAERAPVAAAPTIADLDGDGVAELLIADQSGALSAIQIIAPFPTVETRP